MKPAAGQNAYNQMVGLDPALAKADEARLGPDARKNLVSPEQGRALAQSAGEAGVATPDAVAAIEDEAKIAPSSPDAENRNSRRFSEGIKNLARTILRSAVTVAKHGGRLGKKFLPGYKIAKWVLANEDTIRELFNDNERMSDLVDSLIELLKKLPLKKG